MELKLAKEEAIVKSWNYASSWTSDESMKKGEIENTTYNITLTNKRCILQGESGLNIERKEVLLKDVSGVATERRVNTTTSSVTLGMVIKGILFILAGILVFAFSSKLEDYLPSWLPDWLLIVGGIILVVVGICHFFGEKGKSEISFAIVIYTKALSYDVLSHAVGFGDSYDPTKMGKENSFLTIYVNSAIAKEVVESIGALIVENV